VTACFESEGQQFDLGAFAAAIDAFDGDEFSRSVHIWMCRASNGAEGQSNR